VYGVLAIVVLIFGGCGGNNGPDDPIGSQPAVLVGTWDENGYDRQMILDANGDFQYVAIAAGTPGNVEGSGTWEATDSDLTLHLNSGHFRWLESTNNAPISFTFQYDLTDSQY